MYEACFKLARRPFAPVPDPRSYFPAAAIEQARTTLERVIARWADWADRSAGQRQDAVVPGACREAREAGQQRTPVGGWVLPALLQAFHELKQPCRGMDEGELRLTARSAGATAKVRRTVAVGG